MAGPVPHPLRGRRGINRTFPASIERRCPAEMLGMTPEQRQARARIAGLTAAAKGRTNTRPATAAAEARFEREVLAEAEARGETLTQTDVDRRANAKRRLFYARLAYTSAKARSARALERHRPAV